MTKQAWLVLVLGLVVSNPATAQQGVLVSSGIEGLAGTEQRQFIAQLVESKLSPEMHAVVSLNGEFQGFTRVVPVAPAGVQPANAPAGGNPYRAVVVTKVAAVAAQDNPFFRIAPAPAVVIQAKTAAVQATDAPTLQLSYKAGQKIGEKDIQAAGFEIVTVKDKPQVIELGKQGGMIVIRPDKGATDKAKVEALLKLKGVRFLSPVYPAEQLQQPKATVMPAKSAPVTVPIDGAAASGGIVEPNDPGYDGKIPGFPQVKLWGMKNLKAPRAWAKQTDATAITVAVIDNGVDYSHVEFAGNTVPVAPQFNGFDPSAAAAGHGTHCAGTIGAIGNNGRGVVGVCWKVKIMNIRMLGTNNSAAACVKYAVDHGASVLSNSWTSFNSYDQGLFDAIEYAKDKNVLFVAAAANHGGDNDLNANYPSSYENQNLIAVGAIDPQEQKATFSNWGKTRVDLFAPGVDIWSCMPGNRLQMMSGTSMACPHVAGACALVWAAKGRKTNWSEIRSFIVDNARPVPALKNLCVTGGTLDISKLANDIPPPPKESAGALLGSVKFTANDNIGPSTDGVLRSLEVKLDKPMMVVIGASFDVKAVGGDAAFTVSVGSANSPWDGGERNTSGAADQWNAVALHAVKKLDAGTHTVQLRTSATASNAKFGSGTVTVLGFPTESGSVAGSGNPMRPVPSNVPKK